MMVENMEMVVSIWSITTNFVGIDDVLKLLRRTGKLTSLDNWIPYDKRKLVCPICGLLITESRLDEFNPVDNDYPYCPNCEHSTYFYDWCRGSPSSNTLKEWR